MQIKRQAGPPLGAPPEEGGPLPEAFALLSATAQEMVHREQPVLAEERTVLREGDGVGDSVHTAKPAEEPEAAEPERRRGRHEHRNVFRTQRRYARRPAAQLAGESESGAAEMADGRPHRRAPKEERGEGIRVFEFSSCGGQNNLG